MTKEITYTLSIWENPRNQELRVYVNGPTEGLEKVWLTDGGDGRAAKINWKGYMADSAGKAEEFAACALEELREYIGSETVLCSFDEIVAAIEKANSI